VGCSWTKPGCGRNLKVIDGLRFLLGLDLLNVCPQIVLELSRFNLHGMKTKVLKSIMYNTSCVCPLLPFEGKPGNHGLISFDTVSVSGWQGHPSSPSRAVLCSLTKYKD